MKELEKKIDIARDEQGYLWGSVFIVGGGAITILLNNTNIIGGFAFVIGIVLCLVFLNAFFTRREILIKMVKELKEKE